MRAVTCQHAQLQVADLPEPRPGKGQVLIEVVRCGICGSDLHARHHCNELREVMEETGYEDFMRPEQRIVFGHEFSGRVAEYGPKSRKRIPTGTPVVALPLVRANGGVQGVGFSVHAPGAYAEQLVVEESLMLSVPNGMSPELAALTEPMAVGWHAVRRGEVGRRQMAIVIVRADWPRGDLNAQGQRCAPGRRQRFLAPPPRPRHRVRSGPGRGPGRGLALRGA